MNDEPQSAISRAAMRAGLGVLTIGCGLGLRAYGPRLGLPFEVTKYGGSILWGTMVFFVVATIAPRSPRAALVLAAVAIAVAVELSRLVHTPWLDQFRVTTAGALLLGRVFSPWNIVAYSAGIALGMVTDRSVELYRNRATAYSAS